MFRHLLVIVFV